MPAPARRIRQGNSLESTTRPKSAAPPAPQPEKNTSRRREGSPHTTADPGEPFSALPPFA